MSKLLEESTVFDGIRFKVFRKKYQADNGDVYIRDIVHPGDAALVLPIDENNNVVWIKQLREAVDKVQLELPAGMIDPGETPIEAAKRELEEETGLIANKLEPLTSVYPSIGYTDECLHIFVAKDFTQGHQHFDVDEEITEIVRIPFSECVEMARRGEFNHSNMNVAIMLYNLRNSEQ